MSLQALLPADLRGPATTITRISAGLSGAAVYRVEAKRETFVLKISSDSAPFADWRHNVDIQNLAAHAGVAPRVVHVDEASRAVLSAFVVGRSFRRHVERARRRLRPAVVL